MDLQEMKWGGGGRHGLDWSGPR